MGFARQLILFYQVGAHELGTTCEPRYGGVTAESAFNSLAISAFLFGGHGLFPEKIGELRRPESFFGALHAVYAVLIGVYASGAYLSYYVWGDWIVGDIQLNMPQNAATATSTALSAV